MQDLPQGFEFHKNAIPLEDRRSMVNMIDAHGRWEPDYGRQAQRHGYAYNHKRRILTRLAALPAWLRPLIHLLLERGWMRTEPDQATVQWYSHKSYIDGHIDDPKCFQEDIATVSLESCALYWLADGSRAFAQIVEPGDIVVLRGEARYKWKHGVAKPKVNDRNEQGGSRIITEHGSPRLELGVTKAERQAWRRLSITLRSVSPDKVVSIS